MTTRTAARTAADGPMTEQERLATLAGCTVGGHRVTEAGEYTYHDPVDGSTSRNQGLRIVAEGGARVVFRLSGTGTAGATIRLYLERHEPDPSRHDLDTQEALAALRDEALSLSGLHERTGRTEPTVIT